MSIEYLIEAYHATFRNRNIIYKSCNITEKGVKYIAKAAGYMLVTLLKVLLSNFTSAKSPQNTVFVSWGPLHTRLAKRIGQGDNVVEITHSLTIQQCSLFKNVSISKAVIDAYQVIKTNSRRERTGYDNIFFCIAFTLEFQMLYKLVRHSNHILMAGQADRFAIMLSIIARLEKKYFSFVQHGINNQYEGLYRLHADEIYYLFEISIPFFSTFVLDADKKKYIPIPGSRPNFKANHRYKNAIAFACQTLDFDLQILDIMVNHYKKGAVLIYPHPTEKNWNRYKRYSTYNHVFVTAERISNIKFLISCGSTLGLEYDLIGVPPVFVNLNKMDAEIFHTDKFIVFNDLDSFKNWFLQFAMG